VRPVPRVAEPAVAEEAAGEEGASRRAGAPGVPVPGQVSRVRGGVHVHGVRRPVVPQVQGVLQVLHGRCARTRPGHRDHPKAASRSVTNRSQGLCVCVCVNLLFFSFFIQKNYEFVNCNDKYTTYVIIDTGELGSQWNDEQN
jgi:hypothetical protein